MLTYYRVFCGNLMGGEVYMTKVEAEEAARVRTAMSGKAWAVREIVARVTVPRG